MKMASLAAAAAVNLTVAAVTFAQSPAAPPATQPAAAQQPQPRAPREEVTALLNGKKVTVEYGRPSLRGRTIDQLMSQLGPDRVWRAGVDQVTTLTAESDVMIGGQRLRAGKYSMYLMLPEGGDWHLLLNTDPGVPLKTIFAAAPPEVADALWPRLDGYEKVKVTEVLRVPLKKVAAAEPMERFLIGLAPAKGGVSSITFTWGDQSWTTELRSAR